MDKQTLRAEIRAKKRAMTPAQIEAASGRLAELLFAHPAYRAAKSLYGYLSYNQEVRTAKILQQAQVFAAEQREPRARLVLSGAEACRIHGPGFLHCRRFNRCGNAVLHEPLGSVKGLCQGL